MADRRAFFDVFIMHGTNGGRPYTFEPRRTTQVGEETLKLNNTYPGTKSIFGIELRFLIGGGFDVREEEGGRVLVLLRSYKRLPSP